MTASTGVMTLCTAGAPSLRRVLLAGDLLLLALSLYLSYHLLPILRPYPRPGAFEIGPFLAHAWLLLVVLPVWYVLLEHAGLYSPGIRVWPTQLYRLLRTSVLGLAVVAVFVFTFKFQEVSRLLVLGFCALSVPLLLLGRAVTLPIWKAHCSHAYNITRVMVIGTRERAREFIRRAHAEELSRLRVIGCMDPEAAVASGAVEGVPFLGSTDLLRDYLFAHPVDMVVFAMPLERLPQARSLIDSALELGLRIVLLPDLYVHRLGFALNQPNVALDLSLPHPMVVLSTVPRPSSYLFLKRLMDILISAALLLLLSPLFLPLLSKASQPLLARSHGSSFARGEPGPQHVPRFFGRGSSPARVIPLFPAPPAIPPQPSILQSTLPTTIPRTLPLSPPAPQALSTSFLSPLLPHGLRLPARLPSAFPLALLRSQIGNSSFACTNVKPAPPALAFSFPLTSPSLLLTHSHPLLLMQTKAHWKDYSGRNL